MVVNRRGLALSAAAFIILSAVLGAQKKDDKKPGSAQKSDLPDIVKLVDAFSAGQPATNDFGLEWAHADFLKAADKRQYVPFTLTFDPSKFTSPTVALYWRVVAQNAASTATLTLPGAKPANTDKGKSSKYADESISVFSPASSQGRVSREFTVAAGTYDVYVLVREPSDKSASVPKMAVLKQTVTVPDFWKDDLTTSSILVASSMEPLKAPVPASEQSERPYALNGLDIVPALDAKFTTKGELAILFLIYNPKTDSNHKPDVNVEYNFYSKPAGAPEKFFNKTPAQALNGMTLPSVFDMSAGYQLQTGQAVPLSSFPAGSYRLEIKITDKLGTKTITRDVNFTVTAG
jgi:hypothetical protein